MEQTENKNRIVYKTSAGTEYYGYNIHLGNKGRFWIYFSKNPELINKSGKKAEVATKLPDKSVIIERKTTNMPVLVKQRTPDEIIAFKNARKLKREKRMLKRREKKLKNKVNDPVYRKKLEKKAVIQYKKELKNEINEKAERFFHRISLSRKLSKETLNLLKRYKAEHKRKNKIENTKKTQTS